jgi:hypothetical protein
MSAKAIFMVGIRVKGTEATAASVGAPLTSLGIFDAGTENRGLAGEESSAAPAKCASIYVRGSFREFPRRWTHRAPSCARAGYEMGADPKNTVAANTRCDGIPMTLCMVASIKAVASTEQNAPNRSANLFCPTHCNAIRRCGSTTPAGPGFLVEAVWRAAVSLRKTTASDRRRIAQTFCYPSFSIGD